MVVVEVDVGFLPRPVLVALAVATAAANVVNSERLGVEVDLGEFNERALDLDTAFLERGQQAPAELRVLHFLRLRVRLQLISQRLLC